MRRLVVVAACGLMFILAVAGAVGASPVQFDLAGSPASWVTVNDNANWANLSATLVTNLDKQIFTLADGQTQTVDFFTLSASGIGGGSYSIAANLGFDIPTMASSGSGSGQFFTAFGLISGGTLAWDPATLPDVFTVAGNTISVDFQDGWTVGLGNTATVHAYITNQGGGTASVPEPSMLLLLGLGLVGFAVGTRTRLSRR
jgi:hypothetical protein